MAGEAWHGTIGGYTNHRCRCAACRAAARAHARTYQQRPEVKAKRAQRVAADPQARERYIDFIVRGLSDSDFC